MDYAKVKFGEDDLSLLMLPEKDLLHEIGGRYLATGSFAYSNKVSLRKEVSPASLYLYLLGRYGPPNGVLSMLRQKDERVERTVLWHYTLEWRKRHLHIVCHPYRLDVIFGPGQEVEITPATIADMFRSGMERHHEQVAKARAQVERHRSFLNPLSHMIDSIRHMLAKADELDQNIVKSMPHPETLEDIKWHHDNHEKHSAAAAELSSCCLSVRMMSPVAAEMFVNLLIFNLFKTEGQPKDAKEKFRRGSIIDRVEKLAESCDGFAIKPDRNAEPMRGFLDLMNRRNDLLHGNIKPESRVEDDFQVHDGVPTIMKFRSMFDRSLGPTINAFPLDEAKRDHQAALEFIHYLLSCLDDKWRVEYELMIESLDLHYGMRSKQVRALYGNEFHESIDPDLLQGQGPLPDWLA
jgi:hypothetical protein